MATGNIDTGTDQLLCEVRERVAVITLNRPEARNALGDILTPALRRMIRERGEDPDVGALLITGAGTAFCAGGDVKGMANASPSVEMTPEQKVARLKERQRTLTGALVAVRKPTVAALPGPAAGAGLAIALACDIRIAAASALHQYRVRAGRAVRRLRHRLVADPVGRHGQGAGIALHRRPGRFRDMANGSVWSIAWCRTTRSATTRSRLPNPWRTAPPWRCGT